jgi:hypothetical protein
MITTGWTIDTALLAPRKILRSEPDDAGLGWEMDLDCGHRIWSVTPANSASHCGQCLHVLVRQIRELQERQRIP